MGLGMSMSVSQNLDLSMSASLRQTFGETSGDIPVYSLHRIHRRLVKNPPRLRGKMIEMLGLELLAANQTYRAESGNEWNCLTSNNLVEALEALDAKIVEVNEGAVSMARDQNQPADQIQEALEELRRVAMQVAKDWFSDHYDHLLYDMRGQIPWFVIRKLQAGLAIWSIGLVNPFSQDIEDMVLEVAKENKIDTDDPEDAWVRMGGKVFRKEE